MTFLSNFSVCTVISTYFGSHMRSYRWFWQLLRFLSHTIGALMAPPHLVCSEMEFPQHTCPAAQNRGLSCVFSAVESGGSMIIPITSLCSCNSTPRHIPSLHEPRWRIHLSKHEPNLRRSQMPTAGANNGSSHIGTRAIRFILISVAIFQVPRRKKNCLNFIWYALVWVDKPVVKIFYIPWTRTWARLLVCDRYFQR